MRRCAVASLVALAIATGLESSSWAAKNADVVEAWVTTKDRSRLLHREPVAKANATGPLEADIRIDPEQAYQEMIGFGATITDASAWLIQSRLNQRQRDQLLADLFGRKPGIGLSFMRLTIGASDFSRRHYSLDDLPANERDDELRKFSIDENREDVIPTVRHALAINPQMKLMASPWSAPAWMKTSNSLIKGRLRSEDLGVFARYLVKYVEAYGAEGVPIFALTLQNEPHFEPEDYPGMRVDSVARAELISQHLGPLLKAKGLGTKVLEWDHNWNEVKEPLAVLGDPGARPFIAGVAWHCYSGDVSAQNVVQMAHPDIETYFTECSGGEWAPLRRDGLTWLTRKLVVGSVRAWAKGVLLWNLALDERHGPHAGGCRDCRGVVTIDSRTGAVRKNDEYYVLAHASRFVRPGAMRIASSETKGLDNVAFRNSDDGSIVVIVVNSGNRAKRFSITRPDGTIHHRMPANSVATLVWRAAR